MRKILLILAGLVIVILIGAVVVISQIDVSQYKEQALAEVEKATGRKVSIDGELDLSISLNPAIVAEGIRFANADWGSRPDMATIERIEVQVALLPLLSSEIEVQRFVLIEPDVLLEKNAAGKGNWEIGEAAAATEASSGDREMTAIDINTVLVQRLKLVYKDATTEKPTEFSIDTLKLDAVGGDRLEISLAAALDENPIKVEGKIGDLDLLFDDVDYPIDITASIGAATTTLVGVISQPLQGKGINLAATFDVSKLDQLNSLAGSELPAIGPLSVSTTITDANGTYNLTDLKLTLAETSLSGNVSADISAKVPSILAALQSPMVNLIPFQPEPPADEKVERYLSDDVLPLDGLKAANADVSLKITEVRTRQALINNFDARLKLNDGKLTIKPMAMDVAGGKLGGNLIVDASQKPAGLTVNLNGKNIQLGQLEPLKDKLGGGASDLTIRFSGSGNSTQAIAAGANGKLLVKVGSAEMKQDEKKSGFLASMGELLNPFSKKDNAMLECAVLNFSIKNGIATANKGIGVETQQITVSGGGEINLKNEKIALGFEPNAKGAVAGTITNLASGMKASGTLADPKISINPAGVAMGAIKSVAGGAGSILGSIFGKDEGSATTAKDTAPCQTALTGESTPAKTTAKTQATETPTETKSAPEKILDAPKNLLKGLFGK